MHELAIHAALPSGGGFFELEPMRLAAVIAAVIASHDDFVNHKEPVVKLKFRNQRLKALAANAFAAASRHALIRISLGPRTAGAQRSPSARPCCFQLDGTEPVPPPLPFSTGVAGSSTANIPAAIAAIFSNSTFSSPIFSNPIFFNPVLSSLGAGDATAGLAFASRRSRYPVSSFPARKSASPMIHGRRRF